MARATGNEEKKRRGRKKGSEEQVDVIDQPEASEAPQIEEQVQTESPPLKKPSRPKPELRSQPHLNP